MKSSMDLTGEQESHKLAAVFDTERSALETARDLCDDTSLTDEQINFLSPEDRHQDEQLEPEDQGILRTGVRSHIGLGVGGAVAGFALFLVLFAMDVAFIAQNAVVAASVLTVIAAAMGMMVAGAVTLRPDHTPYLTKAQSALDKGQYVLVVHASSSEQLEEAKSLLDARNVTTMGTI